MTLSNMAPFPGGLAFGWIDWWPIIRGGQKQFGLYGFSKNKVGAM